MYYVSVCGMRTIDDIDGQETVLVRIDVNSPVTDGQVQDNKRFEAHAGTIRELLDRDRRVVLLAHQGRPGRDTYVPLEQHAALLSDHVGEDIGYVDDTVGTDAREAIDGLSRGEAVLLENVRFLDEELEVKSPREHAESELVRTLQEHADAYINDAYSAAHRAHASMVGFPPVLDAYAGPVMDREWRNNTKIRNGLDGNTVMLAGGKKVSDVVQVMEELVDDVDTFCCAGLVGELFLRAEGHDVGYDVNPDDTFMHEQWLENRDRIKRLLREHGETFMLPRDLAYYNDDRLREEVPVDEAAKQKPYWDVGKRTVEAFAPALRDADAVFVKGAPGVFEDDTFAYGTRELLDAIADSRGFTVVGGGDTARAVDLCGLDAADYDHVSIAGGAYIRALTGETLPAIEALDGTTGERL